MQTIIGVRFKKAGKIYYFSPGNLDIKTGDAVIVETARGLEFGHAVIGPREVEDAKVPTPVKVVRRKATEADLEKMEANKEREREAFGVCEKKIAEHGLPMKLVSVEYTFDVNKIVFYFTAEGRIDFRELVKDLAAIFRTRIELRQIGVRDEAKLMGGLGCCGRPLCCASFLGDFGPVSIRMAKEQNLSLNPAKISGICGRLMCCLKYESDCYADRMPKKEKIKPPVQGSRVVTMDGEGKVISVNMQRRSATILLDDSKTVVASWEDVVEKEVEGVSQDIVEAALGQESEKEDRSRGGRSHHKRERTPKDGRSSRKERRRKEQPGEWPEGRRLPDGHESSEGHRHRSRSAGEPKERKEGRSGQRKRTSKQERSPEGRKPSHHGERAPESSK